MVTSGSGKKVWWHCRVDPTHEWEAIIGNRVSGVGCPMCANKVVTTATSLGTLHPDLIEEWDFTKNGDLTPSHVTPQSGKKVWWRCRTNPLHEWETAIYNR